MPIPDYQTIMLPLLEFLSDQKEHSLREIIEQLTKKFALNDEERKQLLPSGLQSVFANRVAWAKTYLKKAGLLESPRRATFRITQRGLNVLKEKPKEIDVKFLGKFSEFVEFRDSSRKGGAEVQNVEKVNLQTPEESLENAFEKMREHLAQEVLSRVKSCSSLFFERLVVELLVKMGYGGSIKDAGQAVGKTGDGGIDGIIKEDRLGLDVIYLQAKRWEGTIGRPEIQKFVGAIHGQRARKGVFITTSTFSSEALDYISKIESKIVLIDGTELSKLMIDFEIGVSKVANYEIKKIDSDFFESE